MKRVLFTMFLYGVFAFVVWRVVGPSSWPWLLTTGVFTLLSAVIIGVFDKEPQP